MGERSTLLKDYIRIFTGYRDSFVIHGTPFTKDGKKTKASFVAWAQYGSKSYKKIPEGKGKGDEVPLSDEEYKAHLNGEQGLAISPLIGSVKLSGGVEKRNVCAYGVIDIDIYTESFTWLVQKLYSHGFKFAAFLSKSGGLHIYFLFSEYEDAALVRETLDRVVKTFALHKLYVNDAGVNKVEVFPEHSERKPGLHDKGVFLPFFSALDGCKNKMLSGDGKLIGIEKALPIIEEQFTSVKEIQGTLEKLPYHDAPYCVQAILLTGRLEEGSHRNDFIFTSALYLKQKYGESAFTKELVEECNAHLDEPLENKDIGMIYGSVSAKDYPIAGQCKKEPMCTFCDKKLCRERSFSAVKKEKDNVASNVEFGRIWRVLAEEPYYIIEARIAGTEDEYKKLHAGSAEELLNQRFLQRECVDKLGQIMWTVKQDTWEERINSIMQNVENQEITRETDTSEVSEVYTHLTRFLAYRKTYVNDPYRINLNQVYKKDGTFYFSTAGFTDYLRVMRYSYGKLNIRHLLSKFECNEDTLEFTKVDGSKAAIKCWSKKEDNELSDMSSFYADVDKLDTRAVDEHLPEEKDGKKKPLGAGRKF